jgi:hypothetical protein
MLALGDSGLKFFFFNKNIKLRKISEVVSNYFLKITLDSAVLSAANGIVGFSQALRLYPDITHSTSHERSITPSYWAMVNLFASNSVIQTSASVFWGRSPSA